MEVFEALSTLRAVRRFRPEPIPEEVVFRILEAGRLAGSAMNRQPWHFVAVQRRETLLRLGELCRTGPYVAEASLAVVVAIEDTPFAVSDASLAIHSMLLAAWEADVGSNWVGFGNLAGVGELVGLPSSLSVLAVLPFGYPTLPLGSAKSRRALDQAASRESYGQPYVFELDLSNTEDLQVTLARAFHFPSWYGQNWNAFWDAITGLVRLPARMRIRGAETLPESEREKLRRLLEQLNLEHPSWGCQVEWVGA